MFKTAKHAVLATASLGLVVFWIAKLGELALARQTDRKIEAPRFWNESPLNIRDRSSIDLSLRDCSRQLRISSRMALAAVGEMAGLKLTKSLPHRFFDFLGRNV